MESLISSIDNFNLSEYHTCEADDCSTLIIEPESKLKIIHQNIRSLNRNFNSFCTLLSSINLECDVIILSECWLSCVNTLPSLNGYVGHSTMRNYNQNDGVVIYHKSNLTPKVMQADLNEATALIIQLDLTTVVIGIYRPDCFKDAGLFINSFQQLLLTYQHFSNIIVIGDMNINVTQNNTDRNYNSYIECLTFEGLFLAYDIPTRENSCLDHVVLKTKLKSTSLILQSTITDHYATLFSLDWNGRKSRPNKFIHKINYNNFALEFKSYNLSHIYSITDPEEAMSYLIKMLNTAANNNTNQQKVPLSKSVRKPWMTQGLLRCIRNRDKLHKQVKLQPDNSIIATTYRRYRNFCNSLLKKLKQEYNKELLDSAGKNNKKIWSAIKSISNLEKSKTHPTELLTSDISPKVAINNANQFFSNVGKNLADAIPPTPPFTLNTGISNKNTPSNSFVLLEVTEDEIESHILDLKTDCAVGYDGLSAKMIKLVKDTIVPPLTHIFNSCLKSGIFPNALKKSIICPIHKAGDRGIINNYRPISILPTLSKILERIINNRLVKFIAHNNLLSKNQFGFRSGKSSEDALLTYTNTIAKGLDEGKKCLTIFLDLAKAFDTVSIPLLLGKLESMGIRGKQLDLFESYLSNRTHRVKIDELTSDDLPMLYGVPQGSILGPTLFLCYINDLCDLNIQQCNIVSYADDTTLTFTADTWTEVFSRAQNGFNIVSHWLAANCLTLNSDKTKYVTFSIINSFSSITPQHVLISHKCSFPPSTPCSCILLQHTQSIKYLGIIIDNNLIFDDQTKILAKRIRKLTFIFKQLRDVASKKLIKQVYLALCESLLTYGISCWGGAAKTHMLCVERAQRLILKVALNKPFRFPTRLLHETAGTFTVRQLYIYHTVIRQHSLVEYMAESQDSRHVLSATCMVGHVCPSSKSRTFFLNRFLIFQGPRLYNITNKKLNIYHKCKFEIKKKMTDWLSQLDFEETENLFTILR